MNYPPKTIHSGEELYEGIRNGVNQIADLVKVTLGAGGQNVALPRPYGSAHVTKDGVSVAREVYLPDPLENMYAQTVKEVSKKTHDDAGDGTTTAMVLAQAIINAGLDAVAKGANPMEVKKGIDYCVSRVVEHLEEVKISVAQDSNKIKQIATVSANGDEEIGNFIAKAFAAVGSEGVIDTEQSKTNKTSMEIVEGVEMESGYVNTYFINTDKQTAEFENPLIFIANKKLQRADQVMKILEVVQDQKRPVIFIATEIINEALAFITINASKHRHPFVAVNAPSFGEDQKNFLEDICIMTGATLLSDDKGVDFDHLTIDMLGNCEKVIVSNNMTTFRGSAGDEKTIEKRIIQLRKNIEDEKEEMKERMLRHRLAKMKGAVAILQVGANSVAEAKEKIDRIDDAIKASRAASAEGIVPGGGVCLYLASFDLDIDKLKKDQQIGVEIVLEAMRAPLIQILKNAELDHEEFTFMDHVRYILSLGSIKPKTSMDQILSEIKRTRAGYDVREERFVDLIQVGIIDPKKVTRVALENSASIGGLILTTKGAMTEQGK